MGKQTYVAPALTTFGGINSITGTIGCYDVKKGGSKGVGYPSDTWIKFIPICDVGDDPGPDPEPSDF